MQAVGQRAFYMGMARRDYRFSSTIVDYATLKEGNQKAIRGLVEVQQNELFVQQMKDHKFHKPKNMLRNITTSDISAEEYRTIITAGLLTQLLHTESRIAAFLQKAYYTIGPCGEEMLGAVGSHLQSCDASALHYRHLSTSIVRHLKEGKTPEEIILSRARGYTVSIYDPVTGGRHCALGGLPNDFLVTSTLASQAPPAVGRALGGYLSKQLNIKTTFNKNFVSYVSVGDGSVNNAHFLAATNLADYAAHRGFYCPTVFGISDNNISISLPGHKWLDQFTNKLLMPVYQCDGTDLVDVYQTSKEAFEYSRSEKKPSAIVFSNLPRRFGHAATDRQIAYYTKEKIAKVAAQNPLAVATGQAVQEGIFSYSQLDEMYTYFTHEIHNAFEKAMNEPKITSREELIQSNSQPLATIPEQPKPRIEEVPLVEKMVMRKHMTRVIDESLEENENLVYLGEDVQHGGYYLVTDGLYKKYPIRVRDFPPDETTLVGCAIGFAQSGLLPVVEIPYAKYLDCGADMFHEATITNWLSNGNAPLGMVVRLQGFDKGVFGGNFHTSNVIPTPCGLDVVCYSNGEDYAKGFRHAVYQAKQGRMVMTVDSTNLLYVMDVQEFGDSLWRRPYPQKNEMLTFDQVTRYGDAKKIAIVTYGNGVLTSLQAKKILETEHAIHVTIIDSPYLSDVPAELRDAVGSFDKILFADVCKERQGPLVQLATSLHNEGRLSQWRTASAAPTFNPLGTTLTFLNTDDIVRSVLAL